MFSKPGKFIVLFFLIACLHILKDTSHSKEKTTSNCDNRAAQINNSGNIVWQAFCGGKNQIFTSDGNKIIKISEDTGTGLSPQINSRGDVVWQEMYGSGTRILIRRKNNNPVSIEDKSIKLYSAPSINDKGAVVFQGGVEDNDNMGRPSTVNSIFLYDSGKTRRLNTGTKNARTPHINNAGDIAFSGWVDKPDIFTNEITYGYTGVQEIFLLNRHGLKKLTDSKTYKDNQSPRINNRGMIAWSGFTKNDTAEIFLYDGKSIKQITANKHNDLSPKINDNGRIVWYGWDGHDYEIFMYYKNSVTRITDNDYDDIEPSLNDKGDIVWSARSSEFYQIRVKHSGK